MISDRVANTISTIFLTRHLGHGRAQETYLTLVAGTYGIALLLSTEAQFDSQATRDLAWWGQAHWIAYLLILKSMLSGYGVISNRKNWAASQIFRFAGALVGFLAWSWFLAKFSLLGVPFTFGSFFAFWSCLFSVRIMALALANLPTPGQPGAM